jgi:hypothetical protein
MCLYFSENQKKIETEYEMNANARTRKQKSKICDSPVYFESIDFFCITPHFSFSANAFFSPLSKCAASSNKTNWTRERELRFCIVQLKRAYYAPCRAIIQIKLINNASKIMNCREIFAFFVSSIPCINRKWTPKKHQSLIQLFFSMRKHETLQICVHRLVRNRELIYFVFIMNRFLHHCKRARI